MSNPAVTTLWSGRIGRSKISFDDNIGESIHLHVDDMRLDMTVDEFHLLYEDMCETINKMIDIDGFNVRKFDPAFLVKDLWPLLPSLQSVKSDKVMLSSLYAPFDVKFLKLKDSIGLQQLNNRESLKKKPLAPHIGQSEEERMSQVLESVEKHGYPYNDEYIVLYGDEMIIHDGQHRASCLYYLYGDIEIPVLRLYFNGYKKRRIRWYTNSIFICCARKIKRQFIAFLPFISKLLQFAYRKICK